MDVSGTWPGEPDELAAARVTEGRVILAELVSERDELQTAAITERDERMYGRRSWEDVQSPALQALEDWDDAAPERLARMTAEQQRCLLFALSERLAAGGAQHEYSAPSRWLSDLSEMTLDLVAGDVRLLATMAEPGAGSGGYWPFRVVVSKVEALLAQGAPGAESLADAVADQVSGWNIMKHHWYGANTVLRATTAQLRELETGS